MTGHLDAGVLTSALLPTAVLIAFGWALRRSWFTDDFWRSLERLAYFVLLPALFVSGLSRADFDGLGVGRMALVLAVSSLLAALLTWALRRLITTDGPAFTSVFQGGVRFNNYIGLVVATAVFGGQGLALAALSNAVLVPLVNVTSTVTLARYGQGHTGRRAIAGQIVTNPLVLGCVLGLGLQLLGRTGAGQAALRAPALGELLVGIGELARILGTAALPIGLMCVGAGLRRPHALRGADGMGALIGWSMALRFAAVPSLTAGTALVVGLSGPSAVVAVLFQSLPTASSAYMLARRLGGDVPLMAAIIAVQTVAGLATVPLWLLVGQAL